MNILAFWTPGPLELLIIVMHIIPVVAFWKICSKAGFPAPLGLLMFVPVVNLVLPLYLAFADWPALNGRAEITSQL